MSGWPDPARPGAPLNPEWDGWHWVGNVVREWLAEFQMWQDRHGYCVKPETWGVLPYGGPCLTPAEVAAQAQERDAARRLNGEYEDHITAVEAERDAARTEVARLTERVAWLEEIREGAGRALCEADGIAPDEPIADGGHVAWELHVYQRAHAALKAWVTASVSAALAAKEGGQ